MNVKKIVGVAVLCAVVTFVPVANAATVIIVTTAAAVASSNAAIAASNAARVAAQAAEAENTARIQREQTHRAAEQNQYTQKKLIEKK
ncbi:hypothetical protein pEaSNUABM54_00168 [Erwinia phage pEa_SNUABM_54]|nr:hypothetical protein pEaSNUABM54_00168 [Erwinia phage pEa_SNUABM_54]